MKPKPAIALVMTVVAMLALGSPAPAIGATGDASIGGTIALEGGGVAAAGQVRVEAYPAPVVPTTGELPLEPNPVVLASATTDEDGQYVLSGLTSGSRYRVKFSSDDSSAYADVWWTAVQDATHPYSGDRPTAGIIAAQVGSLDASILLPLAARVTGVVEVPSGGGWAQVTASRVDSGESSVIVAPGADGHYSLGRLIPGDYYVQFAASNRLPLNYGATVSNPGVPGVLHALAGESYEFSGRTLEPASISGVVVCPNCEWALSSDNSSVQFDRWDAEKGAWVPISGPTWTTGGDYGSSFYPGTYRTTAIHHERWETFTEVSPPIIVGEGDQVVRRIIVGGVRVERLSGADRFETATAVALNYAPGVPVVFIASGEGFADALAAGPAAAELGGPVLLVTGTSVPASTQAALVRLQPARIVIVGGASVISPAVATSLEEFAPAVERIGGSDRYDTSRKVASFAFGTSGSAAYIASGLTFADAVSAGAAAAHRNAPVILVNGANGGIDAATGEFLTAFGAKTLHIVGGTAVVHPGIESELAALPDATVLRHAGADRYATSRAVNADAIVESESAFLASGLNYPDALAGAAYAGSIDAPLFLIPGGCVPREVLTHLDEMRVARVQLLGGPAVVTKAVENLQPC